MVKKQIVIEKIPLKHRPQTPVIKFPSFDMARLHLELLEVKEKRRKDAPLIKLPEIINTSIQYDVEKFKKDREMVRYHEEKEEKEEDHRSDDDEMVDFIEKNEPEVKSKLTEYEVKREEKKEKKTESNKDFNSLSQEEKDKIISNEHIVLLQRWKRLNPEISIDVDFDETDNPDKIKRSLIVVKRHMLFEKNFKSNRRWLTIYWLAVEWVVPFILNIKMNGFLDYQKKQADSYDELLLEMAFDSLQSSSSQHSATFQLIQLTLMNTVTFLLLKFASQKFGFSGIALLNFLLDTKFKKEDIEGKGVEAILQEEKKESRLRGPRK